MKILGMLEKIFLKSKKKSEEVRIDLKEIVCKPKKKLFIERYRTNAVGTQYGNPDGSRRQDALKKVKKGNKVRLVWRKGESGSKDIIYLVNGGAGIGRELIMSNCFGRLDDKTAASVIHSLTKENIMTAARVFKITGGTPKRPKLGCILELETYHGPEEKVK